MKQSRPRRRRRLTPGEPRLTSPLPEGGLGGRGGGEADTDCSGETGVLQGHRHHHHPTPRGLIQHLRLVYRMMLARKLVDTYGYDLVVGVLDELTEIYGQLLDAPRAGPELPYDFYGGRPTKPAEITNPAGFIYRMVQEAAVEMEHAADDVGQVDADSGAAKPLPRPRAINDHPREDP